MHIPRLGFNRTRKIFHRQFRLAVCLMGHGQQCQCLGRIRLPLQHRAECCHRIRVLFLLQFDAPPEYQGLTILRVLGQHFIQQCLCGSHFFLLDP